VFTTYQDQQTTVSIQVGGLLTATCASICALGLLPLVCLVIPHD
jgi:hypothetical protein